MEKIRKVLKDEVVKLQEFECMLNLADGLYVYNVRTITNEDLIEFFKQKKKECYNDITILLTILKINI